MSRGFEVTGIIHTIGDTQSFGQNGFTKREFVIKLTGEGEKEEYPNYVALELIKDKCALMDSYQPGDEIKVQFNLNGRLWNAPGKPEKCFTSLQAWRVERMDDAPQFAQQQPAPSQAYNDFDDDVPF
ncbi:DUF3127 domain-containing protein [Thalassolituus sp.]|uniref:DUF3127 domain-containing protein n=1 Tax=Thalassolituus sp. TaxID=2030822 RepID=UPI003515F4CB